MKKRIDLNGIELDRDYSTPKRFWNACKTVLKNHGIEIEDIFYTYEEWIKPSDPSIAHTNEDGSASENVSCRYHVYCPYRDEVDRGYNYILQYEDGHGYMYVLTDGYEMIEYEDKNEKTENNKNEMESKAMKKTVKTVSAMENVKAMGITLEIATSAHVAHVKANMSTEKPEIIFCRDYAEKIRIENHCNFVMYDPAKINMVIGYRIATAHDFTTEKTIMKSVSACKRIINILCLPSESVMHNEYEKTLEKKKADYLLNLKKIADNKKAKEDNEKRLASERARQNLEKLASHKYKSESVIDSIDKAIRERKPERLNEYSCNSNTLITSIDYTNTDLKEIERLKNKWSKIGLSNDTFDLLEKSKIESDVEKIKRKAVKRTSKNIQKCSNKSLKEITDNAREIMKHNAELTATAKQATTFLEFVSMSRQFKKAFRNVVDIEYNENCLDVSAKLSALHEKQKALDEKRKQLKTKISACDSVISQLEKTDKNKINYPLIDSKLDVIGISLTEYSLTEVQAVKTSINTTLTNVNSKIGNILDDIKALTGINAAYSKIKSGKEIKIDVTTKSLDKNVYFSAVVGYDINKNNSTSAILHIRQLTEKTLKKIGLNECVIDVNYNIFRNSDPDIKLALARQITKRQSYNMIVRQGSKTQYNIYHCAMRNDFDDHDTADIYAVAYTQILNCLSVKNAADIVTAAKIITVTNAKIQHLNKYSDCHVIDKYVSTANRCLKDVYKIDFVKVSDNYNKNKRLITMLENMHNAVKNKNVTALKTSVYNAINDYLTSIRAIREKSDIDDLDSVIESETERFYTLFDDNQDVEYSEKSTILKMCYAEMKKCLNESAAKTFELMSAGYSMPQIAEKKKVSREAISQQITEIKTAFLKCYTDIKNNAENEKLFENNPIFFDPSVFDDCKTISEKSEKIITTYQKNTEIDRIKKTIAEMSATEKSCMIHHFDTFVDSLKDNQKKTYLMLLDKNASDRKIADFLKIDRGIVKRLREKTITKIYTIIEEYTKVEVDKKALQKISVNVLIGLFTA